MHDEGLRGVKASTFGRLVRYARPYLGVVLLALAFSVLFAGGRTSLAYLIKPFLDDVLTAAPDSVGSGLPLPFLSEEPAAALAAPPDDAVALERLRDERLWQLIGIGFVLVLVVSLAHFGKDYLVRWTLGRVLVDLQQALCGRLLTLPLRFHQGLRRGDALTRTLADATRAHQSLEVFFADLVPSVLAVAVALVYLLSISWQLTLAALVAAPPVLLAVAFFGSRIRTSAMRRQETLGEVTQRLVDILSGIKIIKAFRAEGQEEASFRRENERFFRRSMKVVKNRVLPRTVVEFMNSASALAALGGGAWLVLRGMWGLTTGDLAAFLFVMQTAYRPSKDLAKGWNGLMDALPSAERFFELLDAEPELREAPDAQPFVGLREGIHLRDVSFSYGREPVLRDVSLDVRAGDVVAIVGRTGAGKTTLADLLLRFYDPDRGTIELDGTDLRKLDRTSFLSRVAVVTQEPFLFGGTIAENIRYGRTDASDEEVRAAAKAAHVDEFVDALPEGWDTEVGELGVKLSGGQRQRITIARAILRNPDILIFDEATSSLDAKSERFVQDAIGRLLEGRTVFVIAHRLSTVRHADKIVVLDEGRIARVGTHAELASEEGLYRELVALQNGDGETPPSGG